VVVSSTFRDLHHHRAAACTALLGAKLHPVAMEHDSALPDGTVLDSSLRKVRDAVAYLGIVSHLYGQVPQTELNPDGLSLTELEFREARRLGLPMLIFIMGADHPVKVADAEQDPAKRAKLAAFREEIKCAAEGSPLHRVYAEFNDLHLFELTVTQAVAELRRHLDNHPRNPDTARRGPVVGVPPLRGDEVARPQVAEALVAALLAPGAGSVGVTTGLVGAGGFGKTTLARIVGHDQRVRGEFGDGQVWVTVGEERAGPELAALITSVTRLFDPHAPEVTDPHIAGTSLGRALGGRRVLLVVDDVWSRAQVEPFLIGADRAVRLFTTRQRGILPPATAEVVVDQMRPGEATTLLTTGLPALPPALLERALRVTGRWPVLLTLVHGALTKEAAAGADAASELAAVLDALHTEGITRLDVRDPGERDRAVGHTIEISLRRLAAEEHDRYLELAVFGEDVHIPLDVVATLWGHTGGWSRYRAVQFCGRLFDLGLLAEYRRAPDEIVLHDVLRAYLRDRTRGRRAGLDAAIVDAHRALVPGHGGHADWARLPDAHYLWTWLPTHLRAAGCHAELDALLADPAWLVCTLNQVGPAGMETDLGLSDTPAARALALLRVRTRTCSAHWPPRVPSLSPWPPASRPTTPRPTACGRP
jgi:hypothetical protein